MPRIEGADKDNVQVTIIDGWVEKVGADQKLTIKLKGQDEKGGVGVATLWMTGEIRGDDTKSDVTKNLELLESLGLEDGNMLNFVEWHESRPVVTFAISVKPGVGDKPDRINYYLRSPIERIDIAEAAELIEVIRGKAAQAEAEIAGTPVVGDDIF